MSWRLSPRARRVDGGKCALYPSRQRTQTQVFRSSAWAQGGTCACLWRATRRLDVYIDSREALVRAINEYEGAVILVSHDRHLVEATADRLMIVGDGTVRANTTAISRTIAGWCRRRERAQGRRPRRGRRARPADRARPAAGGGAAARNSSRPCARRSRTRKAESRKPRRNSRSSTASCRSRPLHPRRGARRQADEGPLRRRKALAETEETWLGALRRARGSRTRGAGCVSFTFAVPARKADRIIAGVQTSVVARMPVNQ